MVQALGPAPTEGRPELLAAARDYRWLLDRGYPERPAISLVGDRHRLDRAERLTLFRGVSSHEAAGRRSSRRWLPTPGHRPGTLAVDGYNVLFTILNYRAGRPCFLGVDGYLRDAGDLHGRIGEATRFEALADELCLFLRGLGFESVRIWLDRPVSRSGEHAALLRARMQAARVSGGVELCDSADYCVKRAEADVVATADTAIIDACALPCFDLARAFLESRYGARFLDLSVTLPPATPPEEL